MNIKEAKEAIVHTLHAYLKKDAEGMYTFPLVRQRPILLMGAPGIGKTAIMEQIAREEGIGLVSYTMTHHTRQSAVGLPKIVSKTYAGVQMDVTEYTMSEIVCSVYELMERTGKKEGILFIDEINCVSETLAPSMLRLLQNKAFGSHSIPSGWVLVAAGNPQEYNKSAREFDIVTLDRVRLLSLSPDLDAWMEYGWKNKIHGSILSYLSIKKENFYQVEIRANERHFVTARGWEDLSEMLKSYEELGVAVTAELTGQYLQKEEIAEDFAAYYQLYQKYGTDYGIDRILAGEMKPEEYREKVRMAQKAAFDERFTVTGLLLCALNGQLVRQAEQEERVSWLFERLSALKKRTDGPEGEERLHRMIEEQLQSLAVRRDARLLTQGQIRVEKKGIQRLKAYELELRKLHITEWETEFEKIKGFFEEDRRALQESSQKMSHSLEQGFAFVEDAFGDGQEMVWFVTALTGNARASAFIAKHGCAPYFRYSDKLLYRRREAELQKACQGLLTEEGKGGFA